MTYGGCDIHYATSLTRINEVLHQLNVMNMYITINVFICQKKTPPKRRGTERE